MQHLLLHSVPEEPVVLRSTDRSRRWRPVRAHADHLLERFEAGKPKPPARASLRGRFRQSTVEIQYLNKYGQKYGYII